MRFSQANEKCQRTSSHQSTSTERPQAAFSLKFPRHLRLRTRQEFRRVQREGHRIQGLFLIFRVIKGGFYPSRLGITVSKQFGSAVFRNRLKRRIREVFRLQRHLLPQGLSLHVTPKPQAEFPTLGQIQDDFLLVLCKLNSYRLG